MDYERTVIEEMRRELLIHFEQHPKLRVEIEYTMRIPIHTDGIYEISDDVVRALYAHILHGEAEPFKAYALSDEDFSLLFPGLTADDVG